MSSKSWTPDVRSAYWRCPTSVVDDDAAMDYALDRSGKGLTLVDYVRKGIELLDNPTGFFMMVEGGKIDWACHANDAAASIHDTLELDAAIAEAVKFYDKHPDETLIVVTGDHETGGLTIGFAGTKYDSFVDKVQKQTMSYIGFNRHLSEYKAAHTPEDAQFEDLMPLIEEAFGLTFLSADDRAAIEAAAKEDVDAAKRLGMMLSDAEIEVLKQAFMETIKDVERFGPRTSTPTCSMVGTSP